MPRTSSVRFVAYRPECRRIGVPAAVPFVSTQTRQAVLTSVIIHGSWLDCPRRLLPLSKNEE
ncbi:MULTISPECIES: hypothetical protein [unclassified Haladaptatus]|uniref:hypothetical protein n=1 Tax=unclassified Haladaptatus TaxID=2622732 RepID=UPI0023E76CB9|nr:MULTISPECIES: hypothetical protein [unclassified Haladaptatus]